MVVQYNQRQVAKGGLSGDVRSMCFSCNNLISDSEDLYHLGGRDRPTLLKLNVSCYRTFTYPHKYHLRVVILIYLISKIKVKKPQVKEQQTKVGNKLPGPLHFRTIKGQTGVL